MQVGQIVELGQKARRRLHRMPRRRIAARQPHRTQVRDAIEPLGDAADEDLAAPDGAVVSVAGAVAGSRRRRAASPRLALGEHRRDVRAMVLHDARAAARAARARAASSDTPGARRARPAGRPSDAWYIDTRSRSCPGTTRKRREVVEVADVLADERLAVDDQRDRVLQVGADRQDRSRRRDRPRRCRARSRATAAASTGPARADAHDRIVDAPGDRTLADRGTRRRCRRAGAARPRPRRRSARSSGWRSSSPARPARRARTADGAAACTAASRRDRRSPARRPRVVRVAGASTIGRAGDASSASAAPDRVDERSRDRRCRAPSARTAAPCGTSARAAPSPHAALRRVAGEVIAAEALDGDDGAAGAAARAAAAIASWPRGRSSTGRRHSTVRIAARTAGRTRGRRPAARETAGRSGSRYSPLARRAHRPGRASSCSRRSYGSAR